VVKEFFGLREAVQRHRGQDAPVPGALSQDEEFTNFLYNPYASNKGISIGANIVLACLALEPDLPDEPLLAQARGVGEAILARCLGDMLASDGSYREGLGYGAWALRTLMPAIGRASASAFQTIGGSASGGRSRIARET